MSVTSKTIGAVVDVAMVIVCIGVALYLIDKLLPGLGQKATDALGSGAGGAASAATNATLSTAASAVKGVGTGLAKAVDDGIGSSLGLTPEQVDQIPPMYNFAPENELTDWSTTWGKVLKWLSGGGGSSDSQDSGNDGTQATDYATSV